MDSELIDIANSKGLWVIVSFTVLIVMVQAIMYVKLAYKTAKKLDMEKSTCDKALKVGMVTAIGPVIAIFLVMVGLMSVIGGPLSWMRLSIVGSAPTELTAAQVGAEAMGVEFGGPDYDLTALSTSWWTMAINGTGWLLIVALFTSKFELIHEKVAGDDPEWLGLITVAATLGAFGFLNSGDIIKGGGNAVAVFAGALTMMALGSLIDKNPKISFLKEYSLGISMVIGVTLAALI